MWSILPFLVDNITPILSGIAGLIAIQALLFRATTHIKIISYIAIVVAGFGFWSSGNHNIIWVSTETLKVLGAIANILVIYGFALTITAQKKPLKKLSKIKKKPPQATIPKRSSTSKVQLQTTGMISTRNRKNPSVKTIRRRRKDGSTSITITTKCRIGDETNGYDMITKMTIIEWDDD